MIPERADFAVIGSGPSGCMSAGLLAKAGFDVVMLERDAHPRNTVGENMIPDFWKFTDMIGASEDIKKAGFVTKRGGRVHWDGQVERLAFRDFGYDRPGLHVDRDEFDSILVHHAQRLGARLFENVTVRKVDFGEERQSVRYDTADGPGQISVRYVIDASGQGGLLARQLGTRVTNPDFRFMAFWGYFENSRYYDYDGVSHPHSMIQDIPCVTTQVSLTEGDHIGWAWHIPLRKSTSVGCVLLRETVVKLKQNFDNWEDRFEHLVGNEPVLQHLLENATLIDKKFHFINNFSGHSTQIAGPGFFQVGDAAGFFDPIFSIGVTLGLYSGSLAAWFAAECVRKPQNVARYQTYFNRQMLGRIELARGIALPHYASSPLQEDRASQSLRFTSDNGIDLLKSAAKMPKRASNLNRLLI